MGDAGPDRPPSVASGGGGFVLFGKALRKKANKESSNEQGRGNDEKIRWTNLTHVI
jgi:hypothetical protein